MRYVLEGSVRKAGTRVRVNRRSSSTPRPAATSGPSATTAYLEDIFAIQDELTDGIVGALEVRGRACRDRTRAS